MLYLVRSADDAASIYESGSKLHRAGDRLPDGREVSCQAVSDWCIERFWSIVQDELYDFQEEYILESGDVPDELDDEIHGAMGALVMAIAKTKAWQLGSWEVQHENH